MMMWLFLISDALTFGAFIVSLGWFRYTYPSWPVSDQVFFHIPFVHGNFPLAYVAFMTFVLIISSVTMVLAVEAGHRNDKSGVVKWMIATIIGGFIFLGSQVWEWSTFIAGTDGYTTPDLQLYCTAKFMGNPKVNRAKLTDSFDPASTAFGPWLSEWFGRMDEIVGELDAAATAAATKASAAD